jgi:uncharacterized RDD family membrane protein YckC
MDADDLDDAAPLASFGIRAGGFVLDFVPAWLVAGTLAKLAHLTPAAGVSVILLAWGLYNVGFLLGLKGQTPAMRLLGLLCVDEATGEAPGAAQSAARGLSAMLIFAATLLGPLGLLGPAADLLWANWDQRSQTLHDKLARTVVLRVARGR